MISDVLNTWPKKNCGHFVLREIYGKYRLWTRPSVSMSCDSHTTIPIRVYCKNNPNCAIHPTVLTQGFFLEKIYNGGDWNGNLMVPVKIIPIPSACVHCIVRISSVLSFSQ